MGGYNYAVGMSNRAVRAYNDGRIPLSRITLKDLRKAGWSGTRKLAMFLAKVGVWRSSEWHHSGGTWFNHVDFYDLGELVNIWSDLSQEERDDLVAKSKCESEEVEVRDVRVKGSYTLFSGTGRRRRCLGEQEFTGVLRGGWIHIDGGGKKKGNGNYITYSVVK